MAEQFAFEKRLGKRAAVNRDHGMKSSWAGSVNGLGHELLARAALARDQHRGVAGPTVSMASKMLTIAGLCPTISPGRTT